MRQLIIQSVGGGNIMNSSKPLEPKIAKINYQNTIEMTVNNNDILPFLSENDQKKLMMFYPNGECNIWGVWPGKKLSEKNYFQFMKIKSGDVVVFLQDMDILYDEDVKNDFAINNINLPPQEKIVVCLGEISFRLNSENRKLSEKLWEDDKFSCIYFLHNLNFNVSLSKSKLRELLIFDPGYNMRDLRVMDINRSNDVLGYLERRGYYDRKFY